MIAASRTRRTRRQVQHPPTCAPSRSQQVRTTLSILPGCSGRRHYWPARRALLAESAGASSAASPSPTQPVPGPARSGCRPGCLRRPGCARRSAPAGPGCPPPTLARPGPGGPLGGRPTGVHVPVRGGPVHAAAAGATTGMPGRMVVTARRQRYQVVHGQPGWQRHRSAAGQQRQRPGQRRLGRQGTRRGPLGAGQPGAATGSARAARWAAARATCPSHRRRAPSASTVGIHRPDPRVVGERVPRVPGGPAVAGQQLGVAAQHGGGQVVPQPRLVGRFRAARSVEGQRVGQHEQHRTGTRARGCVAP